MKYIIKTLLFLLFTFPAFVFGQEKFTLSGTITDQNSNETLIGVNIIFPEIQTGTTTNEYGFYSITLPKGTYNFQISYLGYTSISESIMLSEDKTVNYKLIESTESLDEIIITEDLEKLNIRKPQMSINSLTINTIKQIPVVLGEVDPLVYGDKIIAFYTLNISV